MTRVVPFDNSINTKQPGPTIDFRERDWSNGLFECVSDCGECCLALICPPIYMYNLTKRASEPCWAMCFGGPIPIRTKIRVERKIRGSIAGDYCYLMFCPFCSIIQMSIEARDTQPLI